MARSLLILSAALLFLSSCNQLDDVKSNEDILIGGQWKRSSLKASYRDPATGQLMTAAEVYFLRAEAALRGWSAGGSAQSFYESGIKTSFEQWKAGDANSYIGNNTNKPAGYTDPRNAANNATAIATTTVKWNDAASNEEKLEKIITQKWLAVFPEGLEAWSEYRRTGYPKLFPVVTNSSGGTIDTETQIRRLPYPQNEYDTNVSELNKGIQLLGGQDNGGTRLWWDVKKGNF